MPVLGDYETSESDASVNFGVQGQTAYGTAANNSPLDRSYRNVRGG